MDKARRDGLKYLIQCGNRENRFLPEPVMELISDIETAEARIVELEESRRWIPVGERLPEPAHHVLVSESYWSDITIGIYFADRYEWQGENGRELTAVTHWQPLPLSPTQAESGAGVQVQEREG